MKVKSVNKSSTLFEAEITLLDGSVRHVYRRTLSDLLDYINTNIDCSCIHDYFIHESSYYSIVWEVN